MSWVTAALLLGLGLRSFHYLRGAPIWHDEAAMIVNVLDKNFAELLGPLRFHNPTPPLFLWLEKTVCLLCGDGELSLRLVPFLASCAALFLMVPVARNLLAPPAAAWAVLLFACSEQLSWHACEAKPYAADLLVAMIVLALFCRANPLPLGRMLLVLGLLAPVLIFLSYPACFVYGGALAALLPAVRREGRAWAWGGLTAVGIVAAGCFLALMLGPVRAQRDDALVSCWTNCFPDWSRPWSVPMWTVLSTFEVGRYSCKPLGQGLIVLAVGGAVLLWKQGQRAPVVALVVPMALALLAAFAHRYPYGGVRVMVFAAPAVLLLSAAAIPPSLVWLNARNRLAAAALVLFLLMPVGVSLLLVFVPWPTADTASAADFVQAHRQADDPVTGNDWTHLYYFRRLGPSFHWPEDDPVHPDARVWVVFTEEAPPETRWVGAANMAPPGWHVVERFDSQFTTAALFSAKEQ